MLSVGERLHSFSLSRHIDSLNAISYFCTHSKHLYILMCRIKQISCCDFSRHCSHETKYTKQNMAWSITTSRKCIYCIGKMMRKRRGIKFWNDKIYKTTQTKAGGRQTMTYTIITLMYCSHYEMKVSDTQTKRKKISAVCRSSEWYSTFIVVYVVLICIFSTRSFFGCSVYSNGFGLFTWFHPVYMCCTIDKTKLK